MQDEGTNERSALQVWLNIIKQYAFFNVRCKQSQHVISMFGHVYVLIEF